MNRETERIMYILSIDALLKILEEDHAPLKTPSKKEVVINLAFLRAFLMDPPQLFVVDGTLNKLVSSAEELHRIAPSFAPGQKELDIEVLHQCLRPIWDWRKTAQQMYRARVKNLNPSRMYYPRIGEAGFVGYLEKHLEELVKSKADSIGPLKYFILRLSRKLRFRMSRLMRISEEQHKEEMDPELTKNTTDIAYETEFAIDSYLVGDTPMWVCMSWLCDLIEEVKSGKRPLERHNFTTGTLSRIRIALQKKAGLHIIPIFSENDISEQLKEVLAHTALRLMFEICTWSVTPIYYINVRPVLLDLLRNTSSTQDVDWLIPKQLKDKSLSELKTLVTRLFEGKSYFILLEGVEDDELVHDLRSILPVTKSIILLTTASSRIFASYRYDEVYTSTSETNTQKTSTSETNNPTTADDVVGFEVETKEMIERLTGQTEQLCIISIVGVAGQGKTTLTNKLYSHLSVANYFHVRLWCSVSQVYEKRKLLLQLLDQAVQLADASQQKNDGELAEMLYKSLKGRRFLIVLDDIWSIEAWNHLRRCFPNDNNGSRIIFTTRLQRLASQAQFSSMLQPLGPLSNDECWELLKNKLFQKESYPSELLEVGRQIAKLCKGLPLSVTLIAGILSKVEKNENRWKEIRENLSPHILENADAQGKRVIELSYKHLPNHLKSCFLYLGAFLEDREIPVSKLIRLWIGEGFIEYSSLKSLEDVAEGYLEDLIDRSLVTVAQKKLNGGVKSCRVHDLLHGFCMAKSREENFWQLVQGYATHFPSFKDNIDYGLDPNYSYSSIPIKYLLRHLRIYSKRNHFIMLTPSGPHVRSLLFFAASDMCPSYSYDISFISHNFKLLRVLNLEDINIGNSFEAIVMLVLLSYLAVQCDMDFIPSSIANLGNLETFVVKRSRANVVKVPNSIWSMAKLRHVHINEGVSFDLDPHIFESSSILDNLQTFSTPSFAYGDDMEKMMRKLRSIRKLKCIFLDSWDDARNCNQFPLLGFLNQLESLKVLYNGDGKFPCQFNFPSNLKKLTLSNFRLAWNEISQLATLRNLEVLKLLGHAFEGEIWEIMEDEIFPKLKSLKLDTLNVVKWSASNENFPCLERLLLYNCKQLEEIPSDIGDIPSLQKIEVVWCSPSLATSARKIQDEQLEYGKELNVHIHPTAWDSESSS